ncbi:MAG TPA: outer membrane lipoprotein carrier protein LolA [Flavobacteriales bacterium]|jgi:outer membrane lipoprotein-sorting protein|nr:outer membrane lipoprotein carrier protein LolA [Flavobacteriales bacterium]|tara:strand:+ start:6276 stop:6911 length:636 start_codon:yes stop_codon:yes gene_type:complete
MRKIITSFLSICIILTNAIGQDKLATDILAKLSETTKIYSSISIEFDHIFTNKSAGINEKSRGKLDLKGENFRIDMPQQLIINNGTTHWIYLKGMNEVQIMDYDLEDEDDISPNKLFTVYDEDYRSAYVEVKSVNGARMHIIDLFPKESGPIMKIRLTINALKSQISILALYDKNGGIYTYNIKSFKTNQELPPFYFNTTNYPDVEVIDLR